MKDHKKQLTSMHIFCPCSSPGVKMEAIEYRCGGLFTPEMAIYECASCGKRKIVVRKPETAPIKMVQSVA